MIPFTLYLANTTGDPRNCIYPKEVRVFDSNSFEEAVKFDHVMALYQNHKRGRQGFLHSDCLPFDCDNDHSDNPQDWIVANDVAEAFPMVDFALSYSKSHMIDKKNRSARPRFHVFFPIPLMSEEFEYMQWKQRISAYFPYFDKNALDSARFLFGAGNGTEICHGMTHVLDFMSKLSPSQHNPLQEIAPWQKLQEQTFVPTHAVEQEFQGESQQNPLEQQLFALKQEQKQQNPPEEQENTRYGQQKMILEGSRNSSMSHFAGKLLLRCGDSQETYEKYLKEAEKCSPPLDSRELSSIWYSARQFFARIQQEREQEKRQQTQQTAQVEQSFCCRLKPTDFSDVGQANILAREYRNRLAYSPATDYLVYNGSFWEESKEKAQAFAQELTERQLQEAEKLTQSFQTELEKNGCWDIMQRVGKKRAIEHFDLVQAMSFYDYETALEYKNFAVKRRDSKYISASLKESNPMLLISPDFLDKNEFLLNTPVGTYDLYTGQCREHNPSDFITKQTSVAPNQQGLELWMETLEQIFVGDKELIDYVQKIVGLCCIGKVYVEALIIAFGEGSNGKSTFWNVISRVLGTYGGSLSSDILTLGCRRNVKPELAEAKGKRLLIASELEEGVRLSTANVKQLCSTDRVVGEKKFKDSFDYVPTHSLILYTNHLPRVGAMDNGTWRRLIVIPFLAKMAGTGDKKNFADHLYYQAGGAILQWMLDGAKKVIAECYQLNLPQKVLETMSTFKENNDWMGDFLLECCEKGERLTAQSGMLYDEYRAYCMQMGEKIRSTTEFYSALEQAGFQKRRTHSARLVIGLKNNKKYLMKAQAEEAK